MLTLKMSLMAIDLRCDLFDWRLTQQMNWEVERLYNGKYGKSCYLRCEIDSPSKLVKPSPSLLVSNRTLEHHRQSLA
jgi:hypothetical protein